MTRETFSLSWAPGGEGWGEGELLIQLNNHGVPLTRSLLAGHYQLTEKAFAESGFLRDNPSVSATIIDKKRRMTLPESICDALGLKPNDQVEWRVEAGEIRGRKLVPRKTREAFPRGSLLKYLTPERDQEQLAILSGCVQGPIRAE